MKDLETCGANLEHLLVNNRNSLKLSIIRNTIYLGLSTW